MGRKVQKKIKYYQTPLMPSLIPGTSIYCVKFEGKGAVHKSLTGSFTNKVLAQKAIDKFLAKFQVEYI